MAAPVKRNTYREGRSKHGGKKERRVKSFSCGAKRDWGCKLVRISRRKISRGKREGRRV